MTAPTLPVPAEALAVDMPIDVPAPPDNLWHGLIVPTNTVTGDGRVYEHDGSDLVPARALPLPLSAQRYVADGHDGAEVVGLIEHIWMEPDGVHAQGTFSDSDVGREWQKRVADGQRWVSGDFASLVWEETGAPGPDDDADGLETADVAVDPRVKCVVSEWEVRGATLLAGPAFGESYIVAGPAPIDVPEPLPGPLGDTLTAAGVVYEAADFQDPRLDGPTALTIDDDGRVYGHLATWGTCHIGMPGCTTAPSSASNYAYFRQGLVRTTAGDLPVGKITMGIGHASTGRGTRWSDAASHYDNTNAAVAVVACGEDPHGIWMAGHLLPSTTDDRVDQLRHSGVSGDWRSIRGNMELVAALAVNVPGFPVPRTHGLVAAGGGSLVAAGVVTPERAAQLRDGEVSDHVLVAAAALRGRMNDLRMGPLRADSRARRAAALSARMAIVAAGPPDEDGTEMQGGQRIVRTEAGAKRYGVEIGEPIPSGGSKTTDAVQSEWEALKAANPHEEKTTGGKGSSKTKTKDTTTKGQVPSGAKKLGSSTPARKADNGDPSAYMEEDEAPDEGAKGGKLTDFKAGIAYYSDGTMSDGANWYEPGETKTTSTSTGSKTSTGTKSTSTKASTKSTGGTTSPTTDSANRAPANPVEAFFKALGELLGVKPSSSSSSAPAAPPQLDQAQRQELRGNLDALRRYLDEQDRQQGADRERQTRAAALHDRMALVAAGQRHVRDADFWGVPVGTPITPGMKPRGSSSKGSTTRPASPTKVQPRPRATSTAPKSDAGGYQFSDSLRADDDDDSSGAWGKPKPVRPAERYGWEQQEAERLELERMRAEEYEQQAKKRSEANARQRVEAEAAQADLERRKAERKMREDETADWLKRLDAMNSESSTPTNAPAETPKAETPKRVGKNAGWAARARQAEQDMADANDRIAAEPDNEEHVAALLAAVDEYEYVTKMRQAQIDRRAAAAEKSRAEKGNAEADRIAGLIDRGWAPDEAESEVTGVALEKIRRRDTIAFARAQNHTVTNFEQAVKALHTDAISAQIEATEGGTVQGYRLKAKYSNLPETVLWTSNHATARKYMTDEMAEWFDQNGRITRDMVRESYLSGRGGMYDTTQQGYHQ